MKSFICVAFIVAVANASVILNAPSTRTDIVGPSGSISHEENLPGFVEPLLPARVAPIVEPLPVVRAAPLVESVPLVRSAPIVHELPIARSTVIQHELPAVRTVVEPAVYPEIRATGFGYHGLNSIYERSLPWGDYGYGRHLTYGLHGLY